MKEGPCACRIYTPQCPLHALELIPVILEGHNLTCPIGIWSCPIDKRTGKPMDDSISVENPLPDEASCDYAVRVTKNLWVEELTDDDE